MYSKAACRGRLMQTLCVNKIMDTEFIHLNKRWNAEPNAPKGAVVIETEYLSLSFIVNPWAYDGFEEGQKAELRFFGCSTWRLGSTNDEGWYSGECRFSKTAPAWGEFYEIKGNLLKEQASYEWHNINHGEGSRHFLFYLRDSTFECDAESYEFIKSFT